MKITKQQLKQIIKEELLLVLEGVNPKPHPRKDETLNPDSMEEQWKVIEDLDVDEDRSEPPHVPSISLEEEGGRTVMDDVASYVDELAGMGITIAPAEKGDGVSLLDRDEEPIANIYYVGKGENRYAVEWMPASNMALRNLLGLSKVEHYGTIEQILSGRVRTTGGDEIHIGPSTLSEE